MKDIIVLSHDKELPGEAGIINGLFAAGLQTFHLRKPDYSQAQLQSLLANIDTPYLCRIVLPATLLGTPVMDAVSGAGIHFFEQLRNTTTLAELEQLKANGFRLSTSVHDTQTYLQLPRLFDYTFFSPVFDSISKQGYSAISKAELAVTTYRHTTKLIALGGINEASCRQALAYGFDGIALLGGIWQQADAVATFKRILDTVTNHC